MRYFLDTEFIEDGETIELISLALVSEDKREYHAINKECRFHLASNWVKTNVLAKIGHFDDQYIFQINEDLHLQVRNKKQIALDILHFVKKQKPAEYLPLFNQQNYDYLKDLGLGEDLFHEKPSFWGYYADYDWVAFCQLFGRMVDLPKDFPMYCNDLKQLCVQLGNPRLPKIKNEHSALSDARWVSDCYRLLLPAG